MAFTLSASEQLFDLLEPRLKLITIANGYPLELKSIYRGRLEPPTQDELPNINYWAAGVGREGQGTAGGSGNRGSYDLDSRQLLVTIAMTDLANGMSFPDKAGLMQDCIETAINHDVSAPTPDDEPVNVLGTIADIRVETGTFYVNQTNEPLVTVEAEILLVYRTELGKPFELQDII